MKRYFHYAVPLTALLSVLPLNAQQSSSNAGEQSARVSMNEIWNSLPDFVCKERIVSSVVEKGKTKEQRVVESMFMAQRKTQTRADGVAVYTILESRELTAIDGKPASKTATMPSAPLFFDGLAANILFISDVPRYQVSQAGPEGRLSVRIGFTTKDSREFLQLEFPAAVSGALIDTQSTKTMHVESRFGALHGGSGIPVSADFQSIAIDGKPYWLPRVVKAEAAGAKGAVLTYNAEYNGCKKFEVSVQIRPVSGVPLP